MKQISSLIIILFVGLSSCKKEGLFSANMDETLYLRNGKSDMPVFVRGNGLSKVFVVVLHGGPGSSGLHYRSGKYAMVLEEHYAMVYWDQRHQGNSHGHLNEDEVTLDNMVDDTYYIIRMLKKRYGEDISVFLYGHSWGGTLGTAYMEKDDYQYEVKGWIESDGAHDFKRMPIEVVKMIQDIGGQELTNGNHVSDWQEMLDFVNDIDTSNITSKDFGKLNDYGYQTEKLLPQISHPSDDDLESSFHYIFLSPNNALTIETNDMQLPRSFRKDVAESSLTEDLVKIKTPTLLLWGKYDFVVPPMLGTTAFAKIGTTDKYLKIYEHSAHSPMYNEPDLYVTDIVAFIEQYK